MAAYLKSNVFSDVYINGNCIVKGTITTLGSGTQWTTAGSAIYYNTGNVGIGTNNPTGVNSAGSLLHIADSTSANPTVHVDASVGTGQARLHLRSGTGSTNRASRIDFFNNVTSSTVPQWTIISGYDQNGTNDLRYVNYAGAITMAWAQNGNIGIGTTNPGSLLTVSGGVGIGAGYQTTLAPTNGMIVQGGVGIGTTNPGVNALQVTGNVVTSGFTSNATNTIFNFDTLTLPFVNATQVLASTLGTAITGTALQVSGNLYATDTIASANPMMFRNRLINGDMRINQRAATSLSITQSAAATQYLLDRWGSVTNQVTGYFTDSVQTLTTSDTPYQYGFRSSMRCTATTGAALPAYIYPIYQIIEANNLTDLNWGSAYGASVTVSFWFRSNMAAGSTGSVCLRNAFASSTWALYNTTFTVVGGGAWQYVVVTVPPPASGTNWLTGTGQGIEFLPFAINGGGSAAGWVTGTANTGFSGQTAWWTTTGNYVEITGVQIEKGLTASPFEFRSYGAELALCQRYYNQFGTVTTGGGGNTGNIPYTRLYNTGASTFTLYPVVYLPVSMRIVPAGTIYYDISDGTITSGAAATATSTSSALIGVSLTTGQFVDIDGWQLTAEY